MIIHQYNFSSKYYDFNSNLDLISISLGNYYSKNYYSIYLFNYPNYEYNNYTEIVEKVYYESNEFKFKFIDNNIFFIHSSESLTLYKIEDKKCILLNSLDIKNLKSSEISIIDLNINFYCLNDGNTILLLNKKNLAIAKSINIVYKNIRLLKISDNFISVFIREGKKLILQNYNVSMGGIKWSLKESKNLLEGDDITCIQNNNYIVFIKSEENYNENYNNFYYNYNKKVKSILFEIKTKKEN